MTKTEKATLEAYIRLELRRLAETNRRQQWTLGEQYYTGRMAALRGIRKFMRGQGMIDKPKRKRRKK